MKILKNSSDIALREAYYRNSGFIDDYGISIEALEDYVLKFSIKDGMVFWNNILDNTSNYLAKAFHQLIKKRGLDKDEKYIKNKEYVESIHPDLFSEYIEDPVMLEVKEEIQFLKSEVSKIIPSFPSFTWLYALIAILIIIVIFK